MFCAESSVVVFLSLLCFRLVILLFCVFIVYLDPCVAHCVFNKWVAHAVTHDNAAGCVCVCVCVSKHRLMPSLHTLSGHFITTNIFISLITIYPSRPPAESTPAAAGNMFCFCFLFSKFIFWRFLSDELSQNLPDRSSGLVELWPLMTNRKLVFYHLPL